METYIHSHTFHLFSTVPKKNWTQKLLTNFYQCTTESVLGYGCVVKFSSCTSEERKKPEADHQDSGKGHRCPSPTSGSYLLCLSEKTELKRSSLAAHTLHSVFFDSHLFPPLWQVQGHKSRNRKTQKQLLSEGLNFTLSHVVRLSFALS